MTTSGIIRVDLAKPYPPETAKRNVTLTAQWHGVRVTASPYGYKRTAWGITTRYRVPNGARCAAMTNLQRALA